MVQKANNDGHISLRPRPGPCPGSRCSVANSIKLRNINCFVVVTKLQKMSNSTERYQKLGLKEALTRIHRYPIACKELSFIFRGAYSKLPKNVQSLIFQDSLAAFRLLPEYVYLLFDFVFVACSFVLVL